MTVHVRTTNGSLAGIPLFNPFASNHHFWWAYPSFVRALIDTQKAAASYVEANSELMDLSLQISRKMLAGMGGRNRAAIPDSSDMNAVFACAVANWRELGEAWMSAQMLWLDAMRSQTSNGGRRHARQRLADEE